MTSQWRVGMVFACAVSLSLVACGDDGDDDDTGGRPDGGLDASTFDGGRDAATDSGPGLDAIVPGLTEAGVSTWTSFFVTSDRNATGNLGGLAGADMRCQRLAAAVGLGNKTWRAYLSVERDAMNGNRPTEARARIGNGPWYNAKGRLLANDLSSLHARTGDAELFLNERGERINGQWAGSPAPNEHDILTGTAPDGGVAAGLTCGDWTLADAGIAARVGHSDGLGPMMNANPPFSSWFSSHESAGCNDTAPRGGAGKIYCFAILP